MDCGGDVYEGMNGPTTTTCVLDFPTLSLVHVTGVEVTAVGFAFGRMSRGWLEAEFQKGAIIYENPLVICTNWE